MISSPTSTEHVDRNQPLFDVRAYVDDFTAVPLQGSADG
jgi:hypothetical protein